MIDLIASLSLLLAAVGICIYVVADELGWHNLEDRDGR